MLNAERAASQAITTGFARLNQRLDALLAMLHARYGQGQPDER